MSLQALYEEYKDEGLMVITMLTQDAQNNVPDDADCSDWADAYGITHPVLADDQGFTFETMMEGYAFPFFMLLDEGMIVHDVREGASFSEEEVTALLD